MNVVVRHRLPCVTARRAIAASEATYALARAGRLITAAALLGICRPTVESRGTVGTQSPAVSPALQVVFVSFTYEPAARLDQAAASGQVSWRLNLHLAKNGAAHFTNARFRLIPVGPRALAYVRRAAGRAGRRRLPHLQRARKPRDVCFCARPHTSSPHAPFRYMTTASPAFLAPADLAHERPQAVTA